MPLVERLAQEVRPMFARHIPLEDLVHAGVLGAIKAVDRYDPGKGQKLEAYAWFVIRGAIIDAHKRRAYREEQHVSIDAVRERIGCEPSSWLRDRGPLPDELADKAQRAATVQMLIAELPDHEAQLMRLVMDGSSVNQAAVAVGRSSAWGRAKLAEARDRIGAGLVLR